MWEADGRAGRAKPRPSFFFLVVGYFSGVVERERDGRTGDEIDEVTINKCK